jgi:hypothetical protein
MAWIKNEQIPALKWKDVEPPPIFRKLYRPLGAIAVAFADLERQLTATLRQMMRMSHREGAALEWLMQNANQRIELFYILASQPFEIFPRGHQLTSAQNARIVAYDQLRKSAEAIYSGLQQANADRNNLLHGAWTGLSAMDGSYSKDRYRAGQGKVVEIPLHGISLELLKEEANYIISVTMRLGDWHRRAARWDRPELWPPPLPDKYLLHSPLAKLLSQAKQASRQRQPRSSRA